MGGMADFTVQAHYEKNPSRASRQVTVMLQLTADAGAAHTGAGGGAYIAETIVLDRSGSMAYPRTKLQAAQEAACAAVDILPDGTMFAVLEGTSTARMVYPKEDLLVPLSDRTRADTKSAVRALRPSSQGTVIGSWLDKARELLEPYEHLIRHATLLTDGRNQHQDRADLDRAIEACRGVLSCDARGIGTDWDPDELLHIVEALHGTAPALSSIDDLTADFTDVMHELTGRAVPAVTLRVRCGRGVTLADAEQSHPLLMDMKQHVTAGNGRSVDFALGPWKDEIREYVLRFAADPEAAPDGSGHRIAAVELLTGPDDTPIPGTRTFVDVRWIDMVLPKTAIETQHELRRELARLIRSGCRAWLVTDRATALRDWSAARALAERLRDAEALGRLALVLDGGALRDVTRELVNQVMLGSSRTGLTDLTDLPVDVGAVEPPEEAEGRECPRCGRIARARARFCESWECDYEFPGDEPEHR